MKSEEQAVDLTDSAGFSHWTRVSIRFSDQDPLGHVNNVAVAAYVEATRTVLIHEFLDREQYPHLNFALVRLEVDYRAEFRYPGVVDVGGRVLRLGTKSFTTGYGVFLGDLCVATAKSVNVFFDTAARAAVEPPESIRAAMRAALRPD